MHYLLKYYYENNTNFDHIGGKQESKIRVDSVWHLKTRWYSNVVWRDKVWFMRYKVGQKMFSFKFLPPTDGGQPRSGVCKDRADGSS